MRVTPRGEGAVGSTVTVVDIRPEVDHVLVALRGELDIATIAGLRGRMARPPAGLMGIRDKLAHALREHS